MPITLHRIISQLIREASHLYVQFGVCLPSLHMSPTSGLDESRTKEEEAGYTGVYQYQHRMVGR